VIIPFIIRIYSHSYHDPFPLPDPTGHGGGFVFDCRGLPNPGRIPEFHPLTGFDKDVILMLDRSEEATSFLHHAFCLIKQIAEAHIERGFTDLSVIFGCTGGRHRSVYCAERMAERLREVGFHTRVIHWWLEREDSTYQIRRAMILAAGFGVRLQPLTDSIPKALVELDGKTMLEHSIDALQKAGFREIAINAHHHAEQIEQAVSRLRMEKPSLTLSISYEPEILGTGGGIRAAARWIHSPNPILIHNVDIWSDFNLNQLYQAHNPNNLATLICQERESSSYLLVDDEDRVCGIAVGDREIVAKPPVKSLRRLGFSGIHIISPRLFQRLLEKDEFSIIDSYLRLIADGETVRSFIVEGNWFDIGKLEKLEMANAFFKNRGN